MCVLTYKSFHLWPETRVGKLRFSVWSTKKRKGTKNHKLREPVDASVACAIYKYIT